MYKHGLIDRPVHIISANLHSVMNCFFAKAVLYKEIQKNEIAPYAEVLSQSGNGPLRQKVKEFAVKNGMIELSDTSGTNIGVQIFDLNKIDPSFLPGDVKYNKKEKENTPVIIVMDYAFGEQAYETMDELLKPYTLENESKKFLDIKSINIMGKAGILEGIKGDIMIPNAHVSVSYTHLDVYKRQIYS